MKPKPREEVVAKEGTLPYDRKVITINPMETRMETLAEEPRSIIISTQHPLKYKAGKYNEDAAASWNHGLIVADGVSRDPVKDMQAYPGQSPSALLAQEQVRTMLEYLTSQEALNEDDIRLAFKRANDLAASFNDEHGLGGEDNDYLDDDLAASVPACAVVSDQKVVWGAMGDTRIFLLGSDGAIKVQTPDYTLGARKGFPQVGPEAPFAGLRARYESVRREFRNSDIPWSGRPEDRPHYGTLTGQPDALDYVVTGTWTYDDGDTLVVCSDGVAPWMEGEDEKHQQFRQAVVTDNQVTIHDMLERTTDLLPETKHDDRTIAIMPLRKPR